MYIENVEIATYFLFDKNEIKAMDEWQKKLQKIHKLMEIKLYTTYS